MMPMLSVAQASATVPIAEPAPYWDQMYDIWLVVAVGIYVIVAVPMLYFLFRYRYRKGINEQGAVEEGGPGIEVVWTVIPLIIVLYLAVQSAAFYTCPERRVLHQAAHAAARFLADKGREHDVGLAFRVSERQEIRR
jgi:heme/copper-type cytochrome/quinol oxidase subunit 2